MHTVPMSNEGVECMKKERRTPIPVTAAFVLLCLVLVSSLLVSGIFARYTAKGDGNSEAHVASFGVQATADEVNPVTITADGTDNNGKATYTVTVKNTGEVAVSYEATVTFTGADAQENASKFDAANDHLTFTGELEVGEEAMKTVTFDMSDDFDTNDQYDTFSNDDISGNKGTVPFEVHVTFTQID